MSVLVWHQALRVSFEVHGLTDVAELLAGQDEVLALMVDPLDATGSMFHAHRDEGERFLADAHVPLEGLPTCWGAHSLHPLSFALRQEGLCGPEAELLVPQELLPGVLVLSARSPLQDVTLQEGLVARGPIGQHTGH